MSDSVFVNDASGSRDKIPHTQEGPCNWSVDFGLEGGFAYV